MDIFSYCLKCKDKKEMVNCELKTNKRGCKYIQASYKDCGGKINKMVKKDFTIENNDITTIK